LSFNNSYAFKEEQLAKYLNVAKVTFIKTDVKDISCEVSDAHLIRCERCWNYYDKSQMADEHICKRCHKIISNS
jgi:isoleucyl-tRNA synthetase